MKIAVLLRGQTKFADIGAELFKKQVAERFPQHEFKVFMHTWKSRATTADIETTVDDTPIDRCFSVYSLPVDTILNDYIRKWDPYLARHHIGTENELFRLAKQIIKSNLEDETFIDWWHKQYVPNSDYSMSFDQVFAPTNDSLRRLIDKSNVKKSIFNVESTGFINYHLMVLVCNI